MVTLEPGRAELRRSGRGVALLAFGSMLGVALALGDEIDATVVNMRFVKPLDRALVIDMARSHGLVVTLEENAIAGGAGSAVAEALAEAGVRTGMLHLGLPDEFIDHGEQQQLLALAGLDLDSVRQAVAARVASLERS